MNLLTTRRAAVWVWVVWCGWAGLESQPAPAAEPTTARFVVALAFPADDPEGLTWPYESLPRAPYDWLVLVVDDMPRAKVSDLRVGGRRPEPAGKWALGVAGLPGPRERQFSVCLEHGRLRVSLAAPIRPLPGPMRGLVQVRLFEVTPAPARDCR